MTESIPPGDLVPGSTHTGVASRRGRRVRVVLAAVETGGRCAALLSVERRGDEPPSHIHHREDEISYVLTGALTYYIGEEVRDAQAGTCVWLPRGVAHSVVVRSSKARVLTLYLPGGFEGYEREIDAPVAPEVRVERMIAVAAAYGCEITGPHGPRREQPVRLQ